MLNGLRSDEPFLHPKKILTKKTQQKKNNTKNKTKHKTKKQKKNHGKSPPLRSIYGHIPIEFPGKQYGSAPGDTALNTPTCP